MPLRNAVDECLDYIQTFILPFDEARLRAPLQLPGWDPAQWGPTLDSAPSTLVFRSAALQPFARFLIDFEAFCERDLDAGIAAFQEARRSLTCGHPARTHLDLQTELNRPHAFMVMEPAATLSDGAACVASHGYFDDHNIPPWDTWVATIPPYLGSDMGAGLLCWVPAWADEQVAEAIAVNPEECLHWAEIQGDQVVW